MVDPERSDDGSTLRLSALAESVPVAYVRQPHFVIASPPRLWHWLPPCFLSPSSSTEGSTLPRMSPSSFESRRWHGCSSSLYAYFNLLLLSSIVSHVGAQWTASPFNPPALPLAVRSPYLNTWLQQGPNPAPASAFWPGTWTQVVSFLKISFLWQKTRMGRWQQCQRGERWRGNTVSGAASGFDGSYISACSPSSFTLPTCLAR